MSAFRRQHLVQVGLRHRRQTLRRQGQKLLLVARHVPGVVVVSLQRIDRQLAVVESVALLSVGHDPPFIGTGRAQRPVGLPHMAGIMRRSSTKRRPPLCFCVDRRRREFAATACVTSKSVWRLVQGSEAPANAEYRRATSTGFIALRAAPGTKPSPCVSNPLLHQVVSRSSNQPHLPLRHAGAAERQW